MGTWHPLANQPTFNAETMLLLTDGTVMCHEVGRPNWHRLNPDLSGSYVNGYWSELSPLLDDPSIPTSAGGPTYAPFAFASAVLPDGRVFVGGGEFNAGVVDVDVAAIQIYDPVSDSWTRISPPPGFDHIGDAPSCVLADGRLLLGNIYYLPGDTSPAAAILEIRTLTTRWQLVPSKIDSPSEETWTLLPNGNVLAVECSNAPNAEQYDPAGTSGIGEWYHAGSTVANLTQPCPGLVPEIGPAVLLPDHPSVLFPDRTVKGEVFAIGASGATGLYTPGAEATTAGTWAAGPDLTDGQGNPLYPVDAPAVLLPSGKVLLAASPGPPCEQPPPTYFLEYDPAVNKVAVVPAANTPTAVPCRTGRLLLLPTGQVLYSSGSADIQVYTPEPEPKPLPSWRPAITHFPATMALGATYTITGTQFNGLSQASSYGDDAQMATNYPIVRLTNAVGKVLYLRSFNFSTMGVATGLTPVTTDVTVTQGEPGQWKLEVIANGIASEPVQVEITGLSAGQCAELIAGIAQARQPGSPKPTPAEKTAALAQLTACRDQNQITLQQYETALHQLEEE